MNQGTLALSIQKNQDFTYERPFPPTPYSSSSSTSAHSNGIMKKYGSLDKTDQLERFLPATPSQTTISPNDDDEGLYLLWTQQLLRERGFTPSSCKPEEESDDDNSSVSSLNSDDSGEDDEVVVFLDQPCASSSNSYYVYQPSTISSAGHVVEEEDQETNKNGFFTCISNVFTSCF